MLQDIHIEKTTTDVIILASDNRAWCVYSTTVKLKPEPVLTNIMFNAFYYNLLALTQAEQCNIQ